MVVIINIRVKSILGISISHVMTNRQHKWQLNDLWEHASVVFLSSLA